MEKYFALIKNGLVESVIIADESFLEHIKDKYDFIIDVSDKRPSSGDSYYKETNTFVSNSIETADIPVDLSAEHLQTGTENDFEPFNISKYSVKYENGLVCIGCKKYPIAGLLDSLHKVLLEKHTTTNCFTVLETGPTHGKFDITWNDARLLYETLKKIKIQ